MDKTKKRVAEEEKAEEESVDASDFDEEMAQVEAEMAADNVEESKFQTGEIDLASDAEDELADEDAEATADADLE